MIYWLAYRLDEWNSNVWDTGACFASLPTGYKGIIHIKYKVKETPFKLEEWYNLLAKEGFLKYLEYLDWDNKHIYFSFDTSNKTNNHLLFIMSLVRLPAEDFGIIITTLKVLEREKCRFIHALQLAHIGAYDCNYPHINAGHSPLPHWHDKKIYKKHLYAMYKEGLIGIHSTYIHYLLSGTYCGDRLKYNFSNYKQGTLCKSILK